MPSYGAPCLNFDNGLKAILWANCGVKTSFRVGRFMSRTIEVVALVEGPTDQPLAEIVAELNSIEAEARETDKALREILARIGV